MKILITGGPVHAKLDAVKFVTNRFKGGLIADLADNMSNHAKVTYSFGLCWILFVQA